MYYLATLSENGIEEACDFGFDLVERIILDECFKSLRNTPSGLVKEKRFCIYENNPSFSRRDILHIYASELYNRFGIYIGCDTCVATVLDGPCLKTVLEKMWMKIYNLTEWHCKNYPVIHSLFDSVVVYDPYAMRRMLSKKKYGLWDHSNDRNRALQVLGKFIDFLRDNAVPHTLVLYNEIFCSRWDSTGQIHFDTGGRVTDYRYFGEGKAFSYVYAPKIDVWQRG